MDFDLFDAFFLDADLTLLETVLSDSAVYADSLPCDISTPRSPSPPDVCQLTPSLSPSASSRSDSSGSGSDAGATSVATASDDPAASRAPADDTPPSVPQLSHKVPYLPPCRVCGGLASGFHYGVNTCEACKGFFHRSLRRRAPYSCSKDGRCTVSHLNRSMCSACRYQQCVAVGMTKEAVKTGRYSHAKRTQDTLEVKRLLGKQQQAEVCNATNGLSEDEESIGAAARPCETSDAVIDHDSYQIIKCLTWAFEQSFAEASIFYTDAKKIESLKQKTLVRHATSSVDSILFGDEEDRKRMLEIREEICTRGAAQQQQQQQLPAPPPATPDGQAAACDEAAAPNGVRLVAMYRFYIDKLEALIRSMVNFAKSVPGYLELSLHDQIVLIKAGRPELLHVVKYKQIDLRLQCMVDYNREKDVVSLIPLSIMRRVWQNDELCRLLQTNTGRLQEFNLPASDVALLAAIVLTSPDREQLLEPDRVLAIQERLVRTLRLSLTARLRCGSSDPSAGVRLLAALLLQLPFLRTLGQLSTAQSQAIQERYQLRLPPLVQECLSAVQPELHCSP